jgi:nitroreductase
MIMPIDKDVRKLVDSPISKVIRERRTIREFKSDPISQEIIVELLNDAVWAPNHGLREPWRFVLFQGEGRKTLAEAVIHSMSNEENNKWAEKIMKYALHVPAHLLVIMKEDSRRKEWEEDFSATAALIQNFQLLAWEQRVGVVWRTNEYIWSPTFHQAVGIQSEEKIVGTLHMGYFDNVPKAQKRTRAVDKLTIISG